MSYTFPNGQPQGDARHFINKLREILIAEVIAINGYQNSIEISDIDEITQAFHSIMLDEKKHYGWILSLLRKYDPEQYKQFVEHKNDAPGPKTPIYTEPLPDRRALLNAIRENVKGEMEAVILYEQEEAEIPLKDVRTILHTIINEERGHAEHLTRLLLKYDPDEYDQLS